MDRRELVSMAWLASIGVLGGTFTLGFRRLLLPDGRKGLRSPIELGPIERLPLPGPEPLKLHDRGGSSRFWWVRSHEGVQVFYIVCPRKACIFNWKSKDGRFSCPCSGSKFELDGRHIEGSAPRGLDRFAVHAFDEHGREVARSPADGAPVRIPAGSRVFVDLGRLIPGLPRDRA